MHASCITIRHLSSDKLDKEETGRRTSTVLLDKLTWSISLLGSEDLPGGSDNGRYVVKVWDHIVVWCMWDEDELKTVEEPVHARVNHWRSHHIKTHHRKKIYPTLVNLVSEILDNMYIPRAWRPESPCDALCDIWRPVCRWYHISCHRKWHRLSISITSLLQR